jgi:hypothetical protein
MTLAIGYGMAGGFVELYCSLINFANLSSTMKFTYNSFVSYQFSFSFGSKWIFVLAGKTQNIPL